jgi:predicted transcriptional regulator
MPLLAYNVGQQRTNQQEPTMGSARFSLRLDAELKDWVEKEAERRDRSAGYIVAEAIRLQKQADEHEALVMAARIAEADTGVFISEEAMTKWFLSLGTDNELPEPEPDIFVNRT